MARASRVQGIRPKRSLRENAVLVIVTRLTEFMSWRGALDDAGKVADLHNMRIAAKRLRYALEMLEVCFEEARALAKELTSVQEALGEIHDLDVLAGILRDRLHSLDAPLEEQAVVIAGSHRSRAERSNALRHVLYAQARDRHRLGLLGLIGDKVDERARKYEKFTRAWGGDALEEFAERVRGALVTHAEPQTSDAV